ncbi:hypothetical protein M3J09_001367 [Ascochyta lentis]
MEDAFNYLHMNGLRGHHNTTIQPPRLPPVNLSDQPVADDADGVIRIDFINRLDDTDTSSDSNVDETIIERRSPVSSNASSVETFSSHGLDSGYDGSGTPEIDQILSRVLVWSTFDESGIARLIDTWKVYLDSLHLAPHRQDHFVRDLAYTLIAKRSRFPWRTFAVTTDVESLTSVGGQMTAATKARVSPKLAFIFTGVSPHLSVQLLMFAKYCLL